MSNLNRSIQKTDILTIIEGINTFTYKSYVNLIKFLKNNYPILPFYEITEEINSYVILRHDIDGTLDAALKMANLENKLKVKSTYFVLFSHKYYNLFEKESMNKLREISKLGHEIGLHYDLETYMEYKIKPVDTLEREIQLLESIIGKKIVSIAGHNPSMTSLDDPFINTNFINAYDQSLYDLYVSDSCRAWNVADLSNMLSFKYHKCQLLIHPFLWTVNICKREDLLEDFFHRMKVKSDATKEEWMKLWNDQSKVKQYDEYIEKFKY